MTMTPPEEDSWNDTWTPTYVLVNISLPIVAVVDVGRETVVEAICPDFAPIRLSDADVRLVSEQPAPPKLAQRAVRVLSSQYSWPACEFTIMYRTTFPEPFPYGLPRGMDLFTAVSRALGGADSRKADITSVYQDDLARLLRLLLTAEDRREPDTPDSFVPLGIGALGVTGQLLGFKVVHHAPDTLPSAATTAALSTDMGGRDRVFTCSIRPDGSDDEMPSELLAWIGELREELDVGIHDHLTLHPHHNELVSHQHRTCGERMWGRAMVKVQNLP